MIADALLDLEDLATDLRVAIYAVDELALDLDLSASEAVYDVNRLRSFAGLAARLARELGDQIGKTRLKVLEA